MIQPDEIIRSNRKTLSISIDPFGRLIVRAPKKCGMERIFAFLEQKESWILRKKGERTGAGIRLPGETLDGYDLLLLGEKYRLCLTEEKKVRSDGMEKRIFLPKEKSEERLVQWLRAQARSLFSELADKWAERMGTHYRTLTISGARRRWGSCSFDNSLHFTFRLLYAPMEVVEYVIVHELAHTKHKNHSRFFWAEVEKYIPDWKNRRKWLKTHGALMEIF